MFLFKSVNPGCPFDKVTNRYVGWWLDDSQRNYAVQDYLYYSAIVPKIDDINKIQYKNFHGRLIYTLTPPLRDNETVLKNMIMYSNGWCICLMSDRIQKDPEMAKMVVEDDPTNIGYLRKDHLNDPNVMKKVVEHSSYGNMIREASDEIKNNFELAKIGLSNSASLSCFGNKIKDSEEMVDLAMRKNPYAYNYASPRLNEKYKNWFLYYSFLKCRVNYFNF